MATDVMDLIARAGMTPSQYITGVVRNTDTRNGDMRVHVTSAHGPLYGDCIGVGWFIGGNVWQVAHFSPARARIIARHLLIRAAALERLNGSEPIDPKPE